MHYCIKTHNLTKRYPLIKSYSDLVSHALQKRETSALKNININIKRGELFGLLGSNGAGKTTLIKILCTMVLPTSGEAYINDLDVVHDEKKIKKIIGYVIGDERSFYWRLTGRQNMKFFAKLNNLPAREINRKVDELLSFMDLSNEADRMFKDYSTGARKKMAIARGLLTNPEIIFMDEPTNGLDPLTAQKLRLFIKERLIKEGKKTIVYATHNLQEAEELCDRIAFIHKGEANVTGTVAELKRRLNTEKIYVVELKKPDMHLLEKITEIPAIKEIHLVNDLTPSENARIELKMMNGNEDLCQIIKQIISLGGMVCSFSEKESSLIDLFSTVIAKENEKNDYITYNEKFHSEVSCLCT